MTTGIPDTSRPIARRRDTAERRDARPVAGDDIRLVDRIAAGGAGLTAAERRVAEVLVRRARAVAFDTVAEIAEQAGVGVATVMRCVTKLGYHGFADLQAAARQEMMTSVPAAARIRLDGRQRPALGALDAENLRRTFDGLDNAVVDESADRLAAAEKVVVVSGDASRGVATQFVGDLGSLRPGVHLLDGNPVAVARRITAISPATAVVGIDVARYDAWVVDAIAEARRRSAWIIALTDHPLSPLATAADRRMLIETAGVGPFESHVATLAVANELVTGVADRIRAAATDRLDGFEAVWSRKGALIDR